MLLPPREVEQRSVADRLLKLDPPPETAISEEFSPEVHPRQMLALGIHEGHGLIWLLDPGRNFPAEWIENLRLSRTGTGDFGVNHFAVGSGAYAGHGPHPDEHGWLQWYLRYCSGRRMPWTDARMFADWGRASGRLRLMVEKNGEKDPRRGLVFRQRLLEWACDPYFDCREGGSRE